MRVYSFCIIFLSVVGALVAQPKNFDFGDVQPPSAEATAMGRSLEVPVSTFTGIPNISIPLHVAQTERLSVPISISYNASGIRAADLATCVGAGWSLNAGGIISRSVVGIPDEKNDGGRKGILHYDEEVNNPSLSQIANGDRDIEPDMFSFSFNGRGGKFIIDRDIAKIVQIPYSDLKIIPTDNTLKEFTILDENGTRYIFGSNSDSNFHGFSRFSGQNDPQAIKEEEDALSKSAITDFNEISEWYLRRIETFDKKDFIDFEYQNNFYGALSPATEVKGDVRIVNSCSEVVNGNTVVWDCTGGGSNVAQDISSKGSFLLFPNGNTRFPNGLYVNRTVYETKVCSKIKYNQMEVIFHLGTENRKDLSDQLFTSYDGEDFHNGTAKFLDKVEIKEAGKSFHWKFDYDYFRTTDTDYPFDYRLKLDKVQKIGASMNENPYEFTYNKRYNIDWLPFRLTKAIDLWGFYNDQENNNTKEYNIPFEDLSFEFNGARIPNAFNGSAIRTSDS